MTGYKINISWQVYIQSNLSIVNMSVRYMPILNMFIPNISILNMSIPKCYLLHVLWGGSQELLFSVCSVRWITRCVVFCIFCEVDNKSCLLCVPWGGSKKFLFRVCFVRKIIELLLFVVIDVNITPFQLFNMTFIY